MANGIIQTVRMAPCRVTFGSTYLGTTTGGVDLTLKQSTKQIVVDSFGTVQTREFISQRIAQIKVPLAETDVAALQAVLGNTGAKITTNTTTQKQMMMPASIGMDITATANATALYLQTLPGLIGDPYYCTYIFPIANVSGDITVSLKVDDIRSYSVEFTAYPDTTQNLMYFHENPLG